MILDFVVISVLGVFVSFFLNFPDLSFDFLKDSFEILKDAVFVANFFIPTLALLPIIIISIALDMTKMAIAVVIRIKSFIPTMGA